MSVKLYSDGKLNNLAGNVKAPIASTDTAGLVKADGTTTSVDENGVISVIGGSADDINYDDTTSAIGATTVQTAIEKLTTTVNGKQDVLTNPLTQSDVVNNLTSDNTVAPLSAAMGKSLNTLIDAGNIPTSLSSSQKAGEAINALNVDLTNISSNKANGFAYNNALPYIISLDNIGAVDIAKTVSFSNKSEQVAIVIGAGPQNSYILSMIGPNSTCTHHYGEELSISYNGDGTAVVTFPGWFRGLILSYIPLTIS